MRFPTVAVMLALCACGTPTPNDSDTSAPADTDGGLPAMDVWHPVPGDVAREGQPFAIEVSVSDDAPMATLSVVFTSDIDGELCAPVPEDGGDVTCAVELTPGIHHLSLSVTDDDGNASTREVQLGVVAIDDLDADRDGFTPEAGDCDDAAADVHPGAEEHPADGVDADCDGVELCYVDADGDASGGDTLAASTDWTCAASGVSPTTTDCDDANDAVHPGAIEQIDDDVDQDCDGHELCYADADADSYRSELAVPVDGASCGTAPSVGQPVDCDDQAADIHPGGHEIPGDGLDGDCDAIELCFADADRDGARTVEVVASTDLRCVGALAMASAALDCDDSTRDVRPGATEGIGDGVDSDCDGTEQCYADGDHDGSRTTGVVVSPDTTCAAGDGEAAYDAAIDCYDLNGDVYPGQLGFFAADRGDGSYDYDCSGTEKLAYDNASVFSCGQNDGWLVGRPECGDFGQYGAGWTGTGSSCAVYEVIDHTQLCR